MCACCYCCCLVVFVLFVLFIFVACAACFVLFFKALEFKGIHSSLILLKSPFFFQRSEMLISSDISNSSCMTHLCPAAEGNSHNLACWFTPTMVLMFHIYFWMFHFEILNASLFLFGSIMRIQYVFNHLPAFEKSPEQDQIHILLQQFQAPRTLLQFLLTKIWIINII